MTNTISHTDDSPNGRLQGNVSIDNQPAKDKYKTKLTDVDCKKLADV